jgi:hypothetical protein
VTETNDRLYIQSLHAKGLGWMPKWFLTTYFAVNIALTYKTESSYTSPAISDQKNTKTI